MKWMRECAMNYMKTNYIKIDRLTLWLAIALVAGGVMARTKYADLERKISADLAYAATLDRLYQDQLLCSVLKTIHDGDVAAAAQRLDFKLCDDIIAVNSQLASADDRTRSYVKYAFEQVARLRPKDAQTSAGASRGLTMNQIEAEKILAQACAGNTNAHWVAAATR